MNVNEITWLNGEFIEAKALHWPLDDRGLSLGDGLFETICLADARPRFFAAHWQRLKTSAAKLLFADIGDGEEVLSALEELAIKNQVKNGSFRILLSRGCGKRGLAIPLSAKANLLLRVFARPLNLSKPLRLALSEIRRYYANPSSAHKTLSHLDMVMSRKFLVSGAEGNESLVLDTEGHISCAGAANLFWIKNNEVFTPSIACATLPGITRGRLLNEFGFIKIGKYFIEELQTAETVFISNSLIGLSAVSRIDLGDNRIIKPATEHPLLTEFTSFIEQV